MTINSHFSIFDSNGTCSPIFRYKFLRTFSSNSYGMRVCPRRHSIMLNQKILSHINSPNNMIVFFFSKAENGQRNAATFAQATWNCQTNCMPDEKWNRPTECANGKNQTKRWHDGRYKTEKNRQILKYLISWCYWTPFKHNIQQTVGIKEHKNCWQTEEQKKHKIIWTKTVRKLLSSSDSGRNDCKKKK